MLRKMMQIGAKEQLTVRTHLKIKRIVDGDGLIVTNIFNQQEEEVRLLGIDAPERRRCRKLSQDEREMHLAAQFLMSLARQSFTYLISIAPVNEAITLLLEPNNAIDVYGRTLAYVYLSNGTCLNEVMIAEGFAKPFTKYYCQEQNNYARLSASAKVERKGLYSFTSIF